MILHIVPDEKFIDYAYSIFEKVIPNNNEFVIISNKKELNYIKKTPVRIIGRWEYWSGIFTKSLTNYECVIIHYLDEYKIKLINDANSSIKFLWIGWGADYYDLIFDNHSDLLLQKTNEFYKLQNKNKKTKIKSLLKSFFLNNKKEEILNKIKFFAPVLDNEYKLLKDTSFFNPKYIDWNYDYWDKNIKPYYGKTVNGNNILIGNSAYDTNNHLDLFDLLEPFKLLNQKIICPLSYGDSEYKDYVIKCGNKLFKEKFVSLDSFIILEDYIKIISSCSIVIMGHLRQQALTNILIMMNLGAKIFLFKKNPVFSYLKEKGAIIFSLEDLNEFEITNFLTKKEIDINRSIVFELWNSDVIYLKTVNLIKSIRG